MLKTILTPSAIILCLSLSILHGTQALAQPAIPDTPAGHTLRTWLDVFNESDRSKIENYVHTVDKSQAVEGMISFRNQTGGFDLLSIEDSEPSHIRFTVKEKNGPTTAVGNILVQDGQPPTIQSFGLQALPPGAVIENIKLDAALRQRVIDGVGSDLVGYYIDAKLAKDMIKNIRAKQRAGAYDKIDDGDAFAVQLTKDLSAISHDLHLSVFFSPFKPSQPKELSLDDIARLRAAWLNQNCAFTKVEILPGNVGYVKFDSFMSPAVCGLVVNAAMGFVSHVDALIFDLRGNNGGDPWMATLIASYLFDERTHLNDLYNRREDSTTQFWTSSWLPGPRMVKQPVFVLVSKRTFSGAEEFAYDLKIQKRATIVGETTGGGAHPSARHVVADYFTVSVPFASAINPISKTNWEGVGVEPDVKVPAADALETSEKLARAQIQVKKSTK